MVTLTPFLLEAAKREAEEFISRVDRGVESDLTALKHKARLLRSALEKILRSG